jgi:hypothetical protein
MWSGRKRAPTPRKVSSRRERKNDGLRTRCSGEKACPRRLTHQNDIGLIWNGESRFWSFLHNLLCPLKLS